MISHKSISSASAAGAYFKEQNQGLDSYYKIEEQGQWIGQGAETLGLSGPVDKEQFENILNGKNPEGTEQLVERRLNAKGEMRCGYDFTWTPDKSYSVAGVAYGDERLVAAMREAHSAAMDYAVKNGLIQVRETEGGVTSTVGVEGLVAARFEHSLSRANDPNYHIHTVIANTAEVRPGEWKAVEFKGLVENKYLLDQVADAHLAKAAKELGYAIEQGKDGSRLVGIDKDVTDQFSKRAGQIKEKLEEYDQDGKLTRANDRDKRQAATLDTRQNKVYATEAELKASWKEQHEALGTSKEQQQAKLAAAGQKQRDHEAHNERMSARDCVLRAALDKTENEAVFTREDLTISALKLGKGEHLVNDIEAARSELVQEGKLYELEGGKGKGNAMTTPEMFKLERDIVKEVRDTADTMKPTMSEEKAQEAIKAFEARKDAELKQTHPDKDYKLKDGQAAAVSHMLTSTDQYIGIQGYAGTGKTAALEAANEAWKANDVTVIGLAPTGAAAKELEAGSGIKSQTIHSFLNEYKKDGAGLTGDHCQAGEIRFVVDESSMLDARITDKLMQVAKETNAQVILIGDTAQLQAVGAGGPFKSMQEQEVLKVAVMDEIQRQTKDTVAQAAVQAIADKDAKLAFEVLDKNGMIEEIKDRDERVKAAAKEYVDTGVNSALLVADRNTDRRDLNEAARELRVERGQIERGQLFTVRESAGLTPEARHQAHNYNVGDIVIAQEKVDGIKAGSEGRVTGIDREKNSLTVDWAVKSKGYGESEKTPGRGDTRAFYYDDTETKRVDLQKDGNKLQVWQEKNIHLAAGDKLVMLKNDKGLAVANSQTAMLEKIDGKGNMQLRFGAKVVKDAKGRPVLDEKGNERLTGGRVLNVNIKQMPTVDHAYAVSTHKSQGQTTDKVIPFHDKGLSLESNYVKLSRARDEIKAYTGDKEAMKEEGARAQVKQSTLDYQRRVQDAEKIEARADERAGVPQTPQAQEAQKERAFGAALKSQVRSMMDSAKAWYQKHAAPEKYKELQRFTKETQRQAQAGIAPETPYKDAQEQQKGQHQAPALEQNQGASRHLEIKGLEKQPQITAAILGRLQQDGYERLTLETLDGKKVAVNVQRDFGSSQAQEKADKGEVRPGIEQKREADRITEALKKEAAEKPAPTNHTEAAKGIDTQGKDQGSRENRPAITANGQTVDRTPENQGDKSQAAEKAGAKDHGQGIESSSRTAETGRGDSTKTQDTGRSQGAETSKSSSQTSKSKDHDLER